AGPELAAGHAVRGVVGTGVDTTGNGRWAEVVTQVARRRPLADDRDSAVPVPGVRGGLAGGGRGHVDVAARAILGALAAADAPVLDHDLQVGAAADRAHRAAHHAVGVQARPAGARDQVLVESQALSD